MDELRCKCFQVDIGKVDANIHPEMSLLEHILLKMDFNYLDTVIIIDTLRFLPPHVQTHLDLFAQTTISLYRCLLHKNFNLGCLTRSNSLTCSRPK